MCGVAIAMGGGQAMAYMPLVLQYFDERVAFSRGCDVTVLSVRARHAVAGMP